MRKIFTIAIAIMVLGTVGFTQGYHKASSKFIKTSKMKKFQASPAVDAKSTNAIFFEDDFEGADLAAKGWTTNNADGDAYDWTIATSTYATHSGTSCVYSASYDNTEGALTPDNWLISPALDLTAANGNVTLEYWVAGTDASYFSEKYGLYVSSAGTAIADFTNEMFVSVLDQEDYVKISVDLLVRENSSNNPIKTFLLLTLIVYFSNPSSLKTL